MSKATFKINHTLSPNDDFYINIIKELKNIESLKFISNQRINQLASISWHSSHLRKLIYNWPEDVLEILSGKNKSLYKNINSSLDNIINFDECFLRKILREHRNRISLYCALNECLILERPSSIWAQMSKAAEKAISTTLIWLTNYYFKNKLININKINLNGLTVLALGKLGGNELNYSSDIDLIFIFSPEKSNLSFDKANKVYINLTRKFIDIMEKPDANGVAWKIDLRLRPDAGTTSIAISEDAAILYYESIARTWERAAFIKARTIAGNKNMGDNFLTIISSFIWRKFLDYSVISELLNLLSQLQKYKTTFGRNIKTDENGIRQVEFFTQIQQLVSGGRNLSVRKRATIEALNSLKNIQWISTKVDKELKSCYIFLRQIEHRLQMKNGNQTHTLPNDKNAIDQFSNFLGFSNINKFSKKLNHCDLIIKTHTKILTKDVLVDASLKFEPFNSTYKERLHSSNTSLSKIWSKITSKNNRYLINSSKELHQIIYKLITVSPDTLEKKKTIDFSIFLKKNGFKNINFIEGKIIHWMSGSSRFSRDHKTKVLLFKLLTIILPLFSNSNDPDSGFNNFCSVLENISIATNLFTLLLNNYNLFNLFTNILTTSPRLAKLISIYPDVLDSFIQTSPSSEILSKDNYKELLILNSNKYNEEEKLENLRRTHREFHFRICLQVFLKLINLKQAGIAFTNLANACLDIIIPISLSNVSKRYGKCPCNFGLVMFGRFASKEMNAASDLDFVVVYNENLNQLSNKQTAASIYFARFARTLINHLSAPMAEGRLYETDMRLRPSGLAGPVATSLISFQEYYKTSSWEWEKIALLKSTPISIDLEFLKIIKNTLKHSKLNKPNKINLVKEIKKMRLSRKSNFPIFNNLHWTENKYVKGGQRDIDFLEWFEKNNNSKKFDSGNNKNRNNVKNTKDLYNSIDQVISSCFMEKPKNQFSKSFIISLLNFTKYKLINKLKEDVLITRKEVHRKLDNYIKHYS